jgi:hypothetical protein
MEVNTYWLWKIKTQFWNLQSLSMGEKTCRKSGEMSGVGEFFIL